MFGIVLWVVDRGLRRVGWRLPLEEVGLRGTAFVVVLSISGLSAGQSLEWAGALVVCGGVAFGTRTGGFGDRWLSAPLAAGGAAVLLASGGGLEQVGVLALAPVVAWFVADLERRRSALDIGVLYLISAAGLFLTLPDTERTLLLVGVAAAAFAVECFGRGKGVSGGPEAAALTATAVLWVVAVDGVTRDAALVGGVGSLGVYLVGPVVARLRRPAIAAYGWPRVTLAVVHASTVVFAARVAGMQASLRAASVQLATVLALALLVLWCLGAMRQEGSKPATDPDGC